MILSCVSKAERLFNSRSYMGKAKSCTVMMDCAIIEKQKEYYYITVIRRSEFGV
jgi:hypothetical protein